VRSVRDIGRCWGTQIDAREMVATVEHARAGALRVLGVPIKLSDTPGAVESPPPMLGQHTRAFSRGDLGMTADEIEALARTGAI
jgi:CoA:oxalate CoA-transferase